MRRLVFLDEVVDADDDLLARSTDCWNRYDASAISFCGYPFSIASTIPPMRSMTSK